MILTDEVLNLETDDGVGLTARTWQPQVESGTGIVLVHGFTGSKDDPKLVAVAERLSADGHHVVSYDARGHGDSDGHCTLGNDEHLDVAAGVTHLRHRADRIVVVGASMGGVSVLRHAAHAHDVDGVVSVSAPARWRLPRTPQGLLAALMTQTSPGRKLLAGRMNVRMAGHWHRQAPPAELIAQLSVPVAVVHGRRDRFLPQRNGQQLFDAANEPRRLFLVEGMGHAYGPAAVPVISQAVSWVLGAA